MILEQGTWKKWEVVACRTENIELIVGISHGPRILSLRLNEGENLLYEDTTNFMVGDWHMYGGHRFTIAPEIPESYFPDNEPCQVVIQGMELSITAPIRPSGLELSLKIAQGRDTEGFDITHSITNKGTREWTGALWGITCVPRSATVMASCSSGEMNFWPGTDPSNWCQSDRQITVKQGGYRGKAGWHHIPISLSASQPAGGLCIRNNEHSREEDCVDNGSNTEIFICPEYIELETLSKKHLLVPGQSAEFIQNWKVYNPYSSLDCINKS